MTKNLSDTFNELTYANQLLEALFQSCKDAKTKGKYLIGRFHEDHKMWYVSPFDSFKKAKEYRDRFPERYRQEGVQPFYNIPEDEIIMI